MPSGGSEDWWDAPPEDDRARPGALLRLGPADHRPPSSGPSGPTDRPPHLPDRPPHLLDPPPHLLDPPPGQSPGTSGRSFGVLVLVVLLGALVALLPRISRLVEESMLGPPSPAVTPAGGAQGVGGAEGRLLPPVDAEDVPAASQYAFMQTQDGSAEPVTWDPCDAIHYVVREAPGVGAAGREAVEGAVAQISAATGLAFVSDGLTSEAPNESRPLVRTDAGGSRVAPVLIAWSDRAETPELGDDAIGLGGGRSVRAPDGRRVYVSGMVRLDTPALREMLDSRRGRAEVQAVIAHELGHVVGAGHASSGTELMSAENRGQTSLGTGDRYVLSVLGRGRCVPGL
ncbi:peptidase [Phycicoccus flavus]|uniref:peptidase n=1 Tax=Phycicoccus flavus TaxID=2502783 RepID=UPI000FEBBC1A|nr:peptidase [Phycicoccus flavus]NHA66830.1 peptidase [Phycicoccus flavus]